MKTYIYFTIITVFVFYCSSTEYRKANPKERLDIGLAYVELSPNWYIGTRHLPLVKFGTVREVFTEPYDDYRMIPMTLLHSNIDPKVFDDKPNSYILINTRPLEDSNFDRSQFVDKARNEIPVILKTLFERKQYSISNIEDRSQAVKESDFKNYNDDLIAYSFTLSKNGKSANVFLVHYFPIRPSNGDVYLVHDFGVLMFNHYDMSEFQNILNTITFMSN